MVYCQNRQAVKAGKYAGNFLRMYGDALVGILPKQAGSLIRPENTQAFFFKCTQILQLVYGKNRQVAKYAGSFLRMYENPLVGILRIHAGSPELKICRQLFIKAILYDFELLFL